MKKQANTIKKHNRFLSLALAVVMLLALALSAVPALAANPIYSPISVEWISQGINRTFSAQEIAADFELVGPFNYSGINDFGTWDSLPDVHGVRVIDFLKAAGIDTDALEPNRIITFRGNDGFTANFMWKELSEPRYEWTYPAGTMGQDNLKQGVQGQEVPSIINFTNPTNRIPRNQLGMTFPYEQNRRTGVRDLAAIVVTDNFAQQWADPHVFIQGQSSAPANALPSGSIVEPGTLLRISSPAGDTGAPKYFFTTDGTDPHPNNPSTRAFNWNSNQPGDHSGNSPNLSIVVPNPAPGQRQFIIKTANFGDGRIGSSIMTYAFNYPFVSNTAFLTGPGEVNIDQTNEIEYKVNAANITDINMFTLRVSYDASKVEFKDLALTLPANLNAWVVDSSINTVAGVADFTIASGARGQVFSSANDTEIATLKFALKTGLAENDIIETELLASAVINPITGVRQNAVIVDGKVSTKVTVDEEDPLLKYDINGDGVFDLLDLSIIIYRYFMVASGEELWAEASTYDHLNKGVIDTANIIALYSLILG